MSDPPVTASPRPPSKARSSDRPHVAAAIGSVVPFALVVLAEAAWISVLAGVIQAFAFRAPVLGIPEVAAFVLAGSLAARLLGRRLDHRWPAVALVLVGLAGVIGWIATSLDATAFSAGAGPAIVAQPGGWMAGLAVLRGFAHAELPLQEGAISRLLGFGVPGLAVAAILAGAIAEPVRTRLLADILVASVVFIVSASAAATLTRLTAIGRDAGFDWRRNPTALILSIGLVIAAVPLALPVSTVARIALETVAAAAIVPLLVVGLAAGWNRTSLRILAIFAGIALISIAALRILGGGPRIPSPAPSTAPGPNEPAVATQLLTIGVTAVVVFGAVVAFLVLTAIWLRRARPVQPDAVWESRTIDRAVDAPQRRRRRRVRRPEPSDAPSAYRALIDELDRHPLVRQEPPETPAEHAARLRVEGGDVLSLDLLAADYALARYGGIELAPREHRRAIARWRDLRRRLAGRRQPGT